MGTLARWVKDINPLVRLLILVGLIIVLASLLFIAYINNLMTDANKVNPKDNLNRAGQAPDKAAKQLSETEYEHVIFDQYQKLLITSDRIIYLVKDANRQDEGWRNELSIQITQMKTLVNKAKQINPPDACRVSHSNFLRGVENFSWASDNLLKSIANNNPKLTDKCVKRFEQGENQLYYAFEKLEQGF